MMMARIAWKIILGLVLSVFLVGTAWADATVDVDGDLSDWPSDAFEYLDSQGDMPPPYADILSTMVTNDNQSGSDGYLYFGVEFYDRFRENIGNNDVDVFFYLDVNGDGDTDDPEDRIIEVTGDSGAQPPTLGAVWSGSGAKIADIPSSDWAYADEFMEVRIPYSVLGLSHGSDSFGLASGTTGHPNIEERSPEEGEGDDGFIDYGGGDVEPLAVRMVGMSASLSREGVRLEWATGSERNNAGFHVYRLDESGRRVRLTKRPIPGQVGAALGSNYRLLDKDGRATDRYLIEDLDLTGRNKLHKPVSVDESPGLVVPIMRQLAPKPVALQVLKKLQTAFTSRPVLVLAPSPEVKLAVREAGLRFLGFDDLASAGLDADLVRSVGLALERRGMPVPVLETAEGFWFVGVPEVDRYADYEVVTARAGQGSAMQMRWVESGCSQPTTSVPHELVLEKNLSYYVASPVEDPFYWAWGYEGIAAKLSFDVPHPQGGAASIQVDVCGTGVSEGAGHRVGVTLAGTLLGITEWDGRDIKELIFSVPDGLLRERENYVAVEVLSGTDVVFVDRMVVSYQRSLRAGADGIRFESQAGECLRVEGLETPDVYLLDVTDPAEPIALWGFELIADAQGGFSLLFIDTQLRPDGVDRRSYLVVEPTKATVPGSLGPVRKVDPSRLAAAYLIVTHPDFLDAARRMSRFQKDRGLRTRIVTTQQAYDSFGHGRPSTKAIRDLIQAARPSYVLLLGGATVDSNNALGQGNADFVPAPFVKTIGYGYEAASDGWYVTKRAAIGRLAVRTSEEALAVVEKITSWHGSGPASTGNMLFLADKDEQSPACFERMVEQLIDACVPASSWPQRLFVRASSDPEGEFQSMVNQGVDVVTFAGHAFLTGWSSPTIVTSNGADGFANEHLFLLLSFTCFDGAFTGPWGEALSWAFVRNPAGGAHAAVAASSLTDPSAIALFSEQILCQLTSGRAATLGQALQEAKRTLADLTPALGDAVSTFNLLGDPAAPNPWR